MDVEIESLVREAVAAAMRDMRQDGVDIAVVDDMVNANGSQTAFGGGEGVDSGGAGGMCGAFAFEDGKIKPGGIYRARTFYRIDGTTIPNDYTGYVSVKALLIGTMVLALTDTLPLPNENESYMPLYKFKDGTIEEDYRGSPHVQMWE